MNKLTADIGADSPRVARCISPILDTLIAPDADAVFDSSVLRLKSVSHDPVSFGCVGRRIIVPRGTNVVLTGTCPVHVELRTGDTRCAGFAFVAPVLWDVAIVVLEICFGHFSLVSTLARHVYRSQGARLTVDTPCRPRGRINTFVADTRRVVGTGQSTGAAVDAKLEAHIVDGISQS